MLRVHVGLVWSLVAVLAPCDASLSCTRFTKSRDGDEEPATSRGVVMGKPLFVCGGGNFAWGGHEARGHVLDDQGRIWSYTRDISAPAPFPKRYTESELKERFGNSVLQSRRVFAEELALMRKKAEIALTGRIEKRHVASDAGGFGCRAYIWESSGTYGEVVLGSSGDVETRNFSPEAAELLKWLRELGV